ncbi:MAG: NADH-quinone oxidoreductase subunit NuoN [Gammaproteobacteria bacterium]|nr:NADH-quinone oxidoreductase subunit NuoN [Gammaproteobacteria bacterium]
MSANLMPMLPELFLLAAACAILLIDLYVGDEKRTLTYGLAQLSLVATFVLNLQNFGAAREVLYHGMFVVDGMATLLKAGMLAVMALVLMFSRDYINQRSFHRGEYYILALFASLGMLVMVSGYSFLTIYLGLELLSLSLYAMVAMRRDSTDGPEAAMKYFVMGALASGLLLYGMSMIYGVTGSIQITEVQAKAVEILAAHPDKAALLTFGAIFLVAGIAFKLGAVPFHMWVPDVYHGAPTSVSALVSSAPKIAVFGMAMRLLPETLNSVLAQWQLLLTILCMLSIVIGNVSAVAQSNIKRMLAFSGIAHIGYFLLGLLSGTAQGYSAAMFYILVYALMSVAGFGMILVMTRAGFECESIDDFKGLWKRSPWHALMMMFIMMSMAGVPPLVGFWPKLEVIRAVLDSGLPHAVWLAAIAVLFAVVGAWYYLRVVKAIFFDEGEAPELQTAGDLRLAFSIAGLSMLVLGLMPGPLLALCAAVFAS